MRDIKTAPTAVENLKQLAATCREEPVQDVFLDSRRLDHCWGPQFFESVAEEFHDRTMTIVRESRKHFGPQSHEAFLEIAATYVRVKGLRAAAWKYQQTIVFVILQHPSESASSDRRDSHHLIVLGAKRCENHGHNLGGGGSNASLSADASSGEHDTR